MLKSNTTENIPVYIPIYMPVLKDWIRGLINANIDVSLIASDFIKEDGMLLTEYLNYEQEQFNSLSHLYDLTANFDIKVIAEQVLESPKQSGQTTIKLIYYYLINHLEKIVCKMTTTLSISEDKIKIIGNNYSCQLVPKYNIHYEISEKKTSIKGLSLAIKVENGIKIKNIMCPELSLESLGKGANFIQDSFYHARFTLHEEEDLRPNQYYQFYLTLEKDDKLIIEKRKIFFDIIEDNLIPFEITNNKLSIIDEHYPVHLTYMLKTGTQANEHTNNYIKQNIEYPRNQTINLKETENIIITDCLDNDWNLK